MKASTFRAWVDLLMYGIFLFLTGTGLLIQYRLVPGSRGGHGLTLLGLSRHEWGTCHFWAAIALLLLLVVHLVLNYGFIKHVVARNRRWLVVLIGLLGVLGVALFLLVPMEREAETESDGHGHGVGRGMGRRAMQVMEGV